MNMKNTKYIPYHCKENIDNTKYVIETQSGCEIISKEDLISLYNSGVDMGENITGVDVDNIIITIDNEIRVFDEPIAKIDIKLLDTIKGLTDTTDKGIAFLTLDSTKLNHLIAKADMIGANRYSYRNIDIFVIRDRIIIASKYKFIVCDTKPAFIAPLNGVFSNLKAKKLDISNVHFEYTTDISNIFYGSKIKEIFLGEFNLTKVKVASGAFCEFSTNTERIEINSKMSDCTNFENMFARASINRLYIKNLTTNKQFVAQKESVLDSFNGKVITLY